MCRKNDFGFSEFSLYDMQVNPNLRTQRVGLRGQIERVLSRGRLSLHLARSGLAQRESGGWLKWRIVRYLHSRTHERLLIRSGRSDGMWSND